MIEEVINLPSLPFSAYRAVDWTSLLPYTSYYVRRRRWSVANQQHTDWTCNRRGVLRTVQLKYRPCLLSQQLSQRYVVIEAFTSSTRLPNSRYTFLLWSRFMTMSDNTNREILIVSTRLSFHRSWLKIIFMAPGDIARLRRIGCIIPTKCVHSHEMS